MIYTQTTEKQFAILDTRIKELERHSGRRGILLETLRIAQELFGFLDKEVLRYIAIRLKLPLSHVYGVASFYSFFRLDKPGEHVVKVCHGTPCHLEGA